MKLVKFVFKFVLWVVAIALVLVLTLPLWVGPVVKLAANTVVPRKTGTAFTLGAFQLNPYTGKLRVGNVELANPEGFSPNMALTLGNFSVDVDSTTVAGNPIVIRDITITDVFVSYVANAKSDTNFGVILRNASGEEKPGGKAEKDVKPATPSGQEAGGEKEAEKKIIIDHLLVGNVVVQLGPMPIPMPGIELRDIGRKSNGVTVAEAWEQIYAQISANFNALGINLNGLIGNVNLGSEALNQAIKTIDASKVLDAKGVKGVLEKSVKPLDATTKALDVTTKATTGTLSATTKAANKTTSTAVDAVNKSLDKGTEGATKAINAIKGLF